MLENMLIVLVLAAILGGAAAKIYTDKKKGVRCSGCPYAKECARKSSCAALPTAGGTPIGQDTN